MQTQRAITMETQKQTQSCSRATTVQRPTQTEPQSNLQSHWLWALIIQKHTHHHNIVIAELMALKACWYHYKDASGDLRSLQSSPHLTSAVSK